MINLNIKYIKRTIVFFCILFISPPDLLFARDYIIVQATTSTENSGLLKILEKGFEKNSEIEVRFVTAGTGQIISNCKRGNCDVLIAHSIDDEMKFVEDGFGVERFDLMYNDFIIVGPSNDPSELKKTTSIIEAMQKITEGRIFFVSRGDESGTHKKEQFLWKLAKIKIDSSDQWHIESGQGMGATLNIAAELDAYTISDRATWLFFKNKLNLDILIDKHHFLLNPYGIIAVNPKKFPNVEYDKAIIFINWLLSEEGKSIINKYKINDQQLFYAY